MCGWAPKVSTSSVEILNSIFQSLTSDDICQLQLPSGEAPPGTLNSLSCQSHCVLLGKNIPISERWLILFEFFPIWWIMGYSGRSHFCLPWPLEAGHPPPPAILPQITNVVLFRVCSSFQFHHIDIFLFLFPFCSAVIKKKCILEINTNEYMLGALIFF